MKVGDRRVFSSSSGAFAGKSVIITECLGRFAEWSAESYRVRLDQPMRGRDQQGRPWEVREFTAFDFDFEGYPGDVLQI